MKGLLIRKARELEAAGLLDEALKVYDELIYRYPFDPSLYNFYADLLLSNNRVQDAIEKLYRAGEIYEKSGFDRYVEAILKKILSINPCERRALMKLTQYHLKHGDRDKALEFRNLYIRYLQKNRFDIGYASVLDDMNYLVQSFSDDMDFVKKAAEIALNFPAEVDTGDFLFSVAKIFETDGEVDYSVELYRQIVRKNAGCYKAYYALGRLTGNKEYLERAKEEAIKRLLDRLDYNAAQVVANVLLSEGNRREASRFLSLAARLALEKGDREAAQKHFLKAYEADGGNFDALENYLELVGQPDGDSQIARNYMALAAHHITLGNLKKAKDFLRKAGNYIENSSAIDKIIHNIEVLRKVKYADHGIKGLFVSSFIPPQVDTGLPTGLDFHSEIFELINRKARFSLALLRIDGIFELEEKHGSDAADAFLQKAEAYLVKELGGAKLGRHDRDTFMALWVEPATDEIIDRIKTAQSKFGQDVVFEDYPDYRTGFSAGVMRSDGALELVDFLRTFGKTLEMLKTVRDSVFEVEVERAATPYLAVFAGREAILSEMQSRASGSVQLVTGGIGLGKSLLLNEFIDRLQSEDAYLIPIRGMPSRNRRDFEPLLSGIGKFMSSLPSAEKRTIAEETGGELPIPENMPLSPDDKKFAILKWVDRLLDYIDRNDKRLVFVVDDMHYLDSSSLDVILHIAENLKPKIGLVLSVNQEPENAAVKDALDRLEQTAEFHRIELKPFNSSEIMDYLLKVYHTHEVPSELVDFISEKTGGNPFYVAELVLFMAKNGHIVSSNGKISWNSPEGSVLPSTPDELLENKIASQDPTALRILQTAAAFDYAFDFDLIRTTFKDFDDDVLLQLLENAIAENIIRSGVNYGYDYEFVNELVRDEVVNSIQPDKSHVVHNAIAQYLENEYLAGRRDAVEDMVAHFEKAGDARKTLVYAIIAGEKALSDFRFAEAKSYFSKGVELFRQNSMELSEDFITRLFEGYAKALERLGEYEKAEEVLAEALEAVPDNARIYNAIGNIKLTRSEFNDALDAFYKALELSREDINKATTLINIGKTYFIQMEYGHAISSLMKAERILLELENRTLLSEVKLFIGAVMRARGELSKARINYKEALEIARSVGNLRGEIHALNNLGSVLRAIGDVEQAEAFLEEAFELAQKAGDIRARIVASNNLGMVKKDRGELKSAIEIFNSVIQQSEKLGLRDSVTIAHIELAEINFLLGNLSEAEKFARMAIDMAVELGKNHYEALAMRHLALVRLYTGEFKEALDLIEKAEEKLGFRYSIEYLPLIKLSRGDFYYRLKRFSEAIFAYRDALNRVELANVKKVKSIALSSLVNIYIGADELLDADKSLVEAEASMGDSPIAEAKVRYLVARAGINAIKNLKKEAVEDIENAISAVKRDEIRIYTPEILLMKAYVLSKFGDIKEAVDALLDAYKISRDMGIWGVAWEIGYKLLQLAPQQAPNIAGELKEMISHFREQGDEFVPSIKLPDEDEA